MSSLISMKSRNDSRITYFVNPAHIIMTWSEGDGITRIKLSDSTIIYPDVTPEIVAERVLKSEDRTF